MLKTVLRDTILSNNSVYQKQEQQAPRPSSPESDDSLKEEKKPKLSLAERVKLRKQEQEDKAKSNDSSPTKLDASAELKRENSKESLEKIPA